MTFAQPLWFWAFGLLPILLALFFRNEHVRQELIRKFVAARLAQSLAGDVSNFKRRLRFGMMLCGLGLVIASLAQPRWGFTWEAKPSRAADVLIAIDVSRSMLSDDITPNRLARTKLAAEDLVNRLDGHRVGIIAFAGMPFLQAPLTLDHSAVIDCIRDLDTTIITRGGTDIADAIRYAARPFGQGDKENRALILFTDGEELEGDTVRAAREQSTTMRIFTVGVGSKQGSLIPIRDSDGKTTFVKDMEGRVVKSRLDEERLREIAEITGGFYLHLERGTADMDELVRRGITQLTTKEGTERMSREPIERYQWPLSVGITLIAATLLINERRQKKEAVKFSNGRQVAMRI
jgi:Ca-activated chloride channel family protein